jgi:phosphatidate cytidylyltransferase
VALPLALILFIPQLLVGKWSEWAMMSYIVVIWANDVFAYLVGVVIGKHRLCERISPKKSWEGFFGGVVGAIGVAVLFGYLFEGNLWVWGGLGVVTALTGVAGDLAESMLKREADVKDSGAMMPGHGGFLDRFDAMLISAPFVFVYLCIVRLLM